MQASLVTSLMLPLALGVIMFGLGLGLSLDDFRRVGRYPRAVVVGLGLQILILPWVAFGLALAFRLPPEKGRPPGGGLGLSPMLRRRAVDQISTRRACMKRLPQ